MTTVLRVPAMLVAAVLSFAPIAMAQDLSPEVQIDLAMAALERAILAEDHGEVLNRIEQLRGFNSALAEGDLLYFEAVSANATGDLDRAESALTRFLNEVGRQSGSYDDAIALMLDLTPQLEARAEVERLAEEQRLAEEARRIEEEQLAAELAAEQARQSEEDAILLAQEEALDLSTADIRHIRWIIHQSVGRLTQPERASNLSDADRGILEKYLVKNGMSPSRFLTADLVQHFRSTPFVPRVSTASGLDPWTIHGDWKVHHTCRIESAAKVFTEDQFYHHPHIRFGVARGTVSDLVTSMVVPNPFRHGTNTVTANVDGESFDLSVRYGAVEPLIVNGRPDLSVVRAIRAGNQIVISGLSGDTYHPVSITFSAAGFTQAFNTMAERCNRMDILAWIR